MMLRRRSDARGAGLEDRLGSVRRPLCFRPQLFADVPLAAGQLSAGAHPIRSHRSLNDIQVDLDDFLGIERQVEQVVHPLHPLIFINKCLFRDPNRSPLLGILFRATISTYLKLRESCEIK